MKKIDFSQPARRKRAVYWHVAGGWLTNIIFIVQGLVLIPIYLEFLGDRLYGFWLATGGVLAWLSMVDVGASSVTQQRCASAYSKLDMGGVLSYFWHGAVVMFGVLMTFSLFLYGIGLKIGDWLQIDPELRSIIISCFYVAGIAAIGRLANDFLRAFASSLQRNQYPVFAQTLGDFFGLVGIIVSLIVFKMGLWSLVIGALLRSGIPLVINLTHTGYILYSIGGRLNWSSKIFSDYLKTTPAVLAAKASGQFSMNLPAVLITRFIGPEANVAYSVTIRVIQMVQSFINHALSGLYAACAHYFNDASVSTKGMKKTVSDLAVGYFVASSTGVSLYALFNNGFVNLWTSEAQFSGQLFTTLAALSSFLHVRDTMFVGMGNSMGAILEIGLTRAIENVLSAGIAIAGIYFLGVIGAPIAVIIAALIMQSFYFRIYRKENSVVADALFPLCWLWLPLTLFLMGCYYCSKFFVHETWPNFILSCSIGVLPFGLYFVYLLPGMRQRLTSAISRA
ncbi:MAG: hypothetical protein AAGH40_14245 [Verrucomicrobiota bacterium]